MLKLAAIAICTAAALCAASRARASDLDLHWSAPAECSDRERLREALSRKLGREVTLGSDAPLSMSGSIAAHSGGYELSLETQSPHGAEERKLQARSCGELVRASLLISALLLSEGPGWSETSSAPEADGPRTWYGFARVRAIGDLGSIAAMSVGVGGAVGVAFDALRFELGGLWLPPRTVHSDTDPRASARMQLRAANLASCYAFFRGPTLAPCLQLELGQLRGEGENLEVSSHVSTSWLLLGAALRGSVELFDRVFISADIGAGAPLARPTFAVHGAGPVYRVPALIGRLELGVEARF
ncbi:MAG TPA: hypothetical protein VJR89_19465 [Polyangiales bacterium]|nr:hypothetical protein [Polyangiales bacterium]